MAVFRTAFERWVDEASQRDLPDLIRESLDELQTLTAPPERPKLTGTRRRDGTPRLIIHSPRLPNLSS
jgi:hypothetical protein